MPQLEAVSVIEPFDHFAGLGISEPIQTNGATDTAWHVYRAEKARLESQVDVDVFRFAGHCNIADEEQERELEEQGFFDSEVA